MKLIFTVTFLDFLAFSAIIPFIPLFFLDTPHTLFSPSTPFQLRYILLGLLFATYPFAQILAAPVLGHFSDKIGRKEVLLLSYLGNSVGYICCGLGIVFSSVIPLFIGNFIAGSSGVNISTVNAIISDLSHDKRRSKFFGFSQMMLGIGFALGPYLSGRLLAISHETHLICFLLFLAASFISFLNFVVVWFFFSHTKEKVEPPTINLREILHCTPQTKNILATAFLLIFGWYFFIKTFQVFLIEKIHCSEIEMFNTISYYGFCSVLSQFAFVAFLYKYIKSSRFFEIFVLLLSLSIFAMMFINSQYPLLFIVPLFSFAYSILMPSLTYFISEAGTYENHGKIMGLNQSVQALAKVLAPALAGCCLALTPLTSVVMSSLAIFASGLVFMLARKKAPETI